MEHLIEGSGIHNPCAALFSLSAILIKEAKNTKEGSALYTMGSMVFSALAFEAALNAIGMKVCKSWKRIERKLRPLEKLKLICEEIGLKIDCSKPPFHTMSTLVKFRIMMVHGKTEVITHPLKTKEDSIMPVDFPQKWEKMNTLKNSEKFKEDLKKAINYLIKNGNIKIPNPLYVSCITTASFRAHQPVDVAKEVIEEQK